MSNIDDAFNALLGLFPALISSKISAELTDDLVDIQADLGRPIKLRYTDGFLLLDHVLSKEDLSAILAKLGPFDRFNRQGIENTLNRVSCMRNTKQEIVGLTLRYARELEGLDEPFRDFLDKNILIIGVPGKGKTSHLRCIANYLATECNREVVIVDKTNEIAGYSDTPHPIVGLARRLQVVDRQALSMLEAVENHTPNTIIVDEIRDREEALAAKTIGERGVQLIATCHGRTFFDVVKNPVLAPVLGGISSVTLKDDTAKAAGSNKNVLERESFPTFDVAIELTAFDEIAVYVNLEESIDALLRKEEVTPTILRKIGDKWVCIQHSAIKPKVIHEPKPEARLVLKKKR